jgi:predicted metalloprotease
VLVTPTPEPTKTEIDVVAPAPAEDLVANRQQVFCPKGTHEGCHTYDDMETYLTHILALVSPMFDQVYGSANRPSHFYYIATGRVGTTACPAPGNTLAPYDSSSYLYCGIDQAIYTGQDQLWQFYAGLGDAAPAVGYAHEWGHHIQTIMEVPWPRNQQEAIQRENQADCIAGAWVKYAHKSGYLEYPADMGDIERLLQTIASAESNIYRTHGTQEERRYAVEYGYFYGLRGCNQYFPNTPIFNG